MKYYSIGYAVNDGLPEVTREDVQKLTHMNLAFGLISENGLLDLHQMTHLDLIPQFRDWNPALRVVLSVGGWGAGGFSLMSRTEEGRRAFAESCRKAVEEYHLDGIDIDWEYPCSDQAEIDCDSSDKQNYTKLLQALRDALGMNRIVSTAVGAGDYFPENTEMDKVAEIVDYVQLMTYDMRNGFTHQAGHHASLSASRSDTSNTNTRYIVELFHNAGVPYNKLVVGAAFYCRHYTGAANVNNGLLQEASAGMYGPNYDGLTEEFRREHNYTEYWDKDAEAAYLWNGETFISFESPEAIRRKCEYVKEKGMLGVMYWEHSADHTRELLTVIAKTLNI